jgi:hypothetical protein
MFFGGGAYKLDNPGSPVPLAFETTTRAWWQYLADQELLSATCACVWQGKTYIANGVNGLSGDKSVFRIDLYAEDEGTQSFVWRNVSTSGIAFASAFNGPVYTNYTGVFDVTYATAEAITAYVTPWDSLIGQCTGVQTRYETVTTIGGPDVLRWYGTTLRVKSGGKR